MKKIFSVFVAATVAMFVGIAAFGATYYVSPDGTSSGSGTEGSPYDLATGWAKLTGTADVELVLADGTYTLDAQLKAVDMNSGSGYTYLIRSKSGNPANCVIDGQEKCRCIYIRDRGVSDRHAIVRGLTITRGKYTSSSGVYDTGGAIVIQGTLDNCIVSDSSVVSNGKLAYGGGVHCFPNTVITNCIIKNCKAEVTSGNNGCRGGGICTVEDAGKLTVVDSQILDCSVTAQHTEDKESGGGGLYNFGCNMTIRNVLISGCSVTNCNASAPQYVKGGGVYTRITSDSLEDVSIVGCSSSGAGGAIYMNDSSGSISLNRCLVKDNSSATTAAICMGNTASLGGNLVMSNCAVRANASTGGKGVIKTGRGATIVESVIEDNEVNTAGGDEGGIVYCYGADLCANALPHLYERLLIRGNSSSGALSSNRYKDGIFWVHCTGNSGNCYSNITVRSCYIIGNTATLVASVYNAWPNATREGNAYCMRFLNCSITGNSLNSAAAMFHPRTDSNPSKVYTEVRNCDLRGNTGATMVLVDGAYSLNPRKVSHCAYDEGMTKISTDAADGNRTDGELAGNGAYFTWMDDALDAGDGTYSETVSSTYGVNVTLNNKVRRHLGAKPDIGARETDEGGTPSKQDAFELEILSRTAMTNALVLTEGESYTFPELTGSAYIFNQSAHRFLSFNGNVVTALSAGIGSFRAYNQDGSFIATVPVFIKPANRTIDNVYILKTENYLVNSYTWSTASSWAKVGSAENTGFPNGQNDIAFVPFSSENIYLNVDGQYTLAALYVSSITDNFGVNAYLRGSLSDGTASLSFYGATGKNAVPACLMAANQSQSNVLSFHPRGDNASQKITIKVVQGTLDFDCGGWISKEKAANDGAHCMRWWSNTNYGFIDIAEGCTLRLVNAIRWGSFSDSQMDAYQHVSFGGIGTLTGSGAIEFSSGSPVGLWDNVLCNFSGTVRSESLSYMRGCNENRCGIVWSTAINATNAAGEVNGYVTRNFSPAYGVGAWTSGNTHGYGAPGSLVGHCLPTKKFTLNGGLLYLIGLNKGGSATTFWKRDYGGFEGHYETSELCVGKGLSAIFNGWAQTRSDPNVISHFIADSITHSDSCGTLRVSDSHFRNVKAFGTYRSENTLKGFSNHYVGYTGDPDTANNIFPIVPWAIGNSDDSADKFWWLGTDSDGNVIRVGNRNKVDRYSMLENQNAYVSGNINLAADKDINSLILSNNGSEMKLGYGMKLTIRSGGLGLEGAYSSLGVQTGGVTNGSVVFAEKAFVYATSGDENNPNQIWSKVTAEKGFVSGYCGNLLLGGDQSGIKGELTVNNGTLQLGAKDGSTNCVLGVSTVRAIGGNTVLRINAAGALAGKTVKFECPGDFSPKFNLKNADQEICYKFYIDGTAVKSGSWGATGSGAANIDDDHFTGTGVLVVQRDDNGVGFSMVFRP